MTSFALQPTLVGRTMTLRPMRADDLDPLYGAASDPLVWEQHPQPTRCQRPVFEQSYFAPGLASGGALVVVEHASGELVGSSRFYEWDPERQEVAIGYSFLVRRLWGGATNGEVKGLLIAHAHRWARTIWFHVGSTNWRSRKAMEKIGGVFDREAPQVLNGVVHDAVWYRIDRP